MNNDELMNRRRFFKKAAKGLLPMLGAVVAGPSAVMETLTSCSKDGGGCDGCEAACMDSCQTTCSGSCVGAASGSTPVLVFKGEGTLSNPYYASDAVKFAKSLPEDQPTTESYYIKGKVSKIYGNYDNGVGWAYFDISDDGKDKNPLTAEVYYFNNLAYLSGPLLKVGDSVVIYGCLEYDVGLIPFCTPGYLYSLNGQTSGGSGTCPECASTCTVSCNDTCKYSSGSSSCSNCASDCSSGCSTGCSTTCKGTSSGSSCSSCGSGCASGCSTGCKGSCGTGCGTGCQGKCDTSCSTNCGGYCKVTCGGSCQDGCANSCSWQCPANSKSGCSGTCYGTCSTTCAKTCSGYCYSTCKNVGHA